mmetsp:Transcript_125687/g.363643  ORF Transcript_125687/g.363643 Transcript_125687/m.363643 type:complete len:256 (+) Transcript_125687:139-906(+)
MSSSGEENEFGDESSEDAPMSTLKNDGEDESPSKRRRSSVNYAEDGDDDDFEEDDDVPLAALASPSPKKAKKSKETATKKTVKKKAASSSASVASSTKSATSSTDYRSASHALYGSECDKGKLIQSLLCRWWYAIEWPDPAAIPSTPPKHYDPLDGFPGVYVCTQGEEVGAIKDFRDKEKCPNFNNMAKKSSEELKELLIVALTEQRRQLVEAEGQGTDTLKELDKLMKWTTKVNVKSADKKAAAILKAAKYSLD